MKESVPYYTAQAVREIDRLAIEQFNIPGYELMQRAGKAAFIALYQRWPNVKKLLVFCGTGKNGGDGFVVAMLAITAGLEADVYLAGDRSTIDGDALKAFTAAVGANIPIHPALPFPDLGNTEDTVIVDALLGTGLSGEVREPYRDVIDHINNAGLPVVALDVPSGLSSDTGAVLGTSVKADLTVTFIGRKLGLIQGKGKTKSGKVVFDDLKVPADVYSQVPAAKLL
jgi:NAD(P)H-hydrate epimerase